MKKLLLTALAVGVTNMAFFALGGPLYYNAAVEAQKSSFPDAVKGYPEASFALIMIVALSVLLHLLWNTLRQIHSVKAFNTEPQLWAVFSW